MQVDIELPEDLPLKEAHAIGETLQIRIEELAEVEPEHSILDFECDHKPEHSILVKLPRSQPGRKNYFFGLTYQDVIIIIENLHAFLVKAVI